jgi:hypothetical protein
MIISELFDLSAQPASVTRCIPAIDKEQPAGFMTHNAGIIKKDRDVSYTGRRRDSEVCTPHGDAFMPSRGFWKRLVRKLDGPALPVYHFLFGAASL